MQASLYSEIVYVVAVTSDHILHTILEQGERQFTENNLQNL